MKSLLLLLTLTSLSVAQNAGGDTKSQSPKQAEIIRAVNARSLTPNGAAAGLRKMEKGTILDVVGENFADIVVTYGETRLVISKADVRLFDKQPSPQATKPGFKPGQLIILSAKYSLTGNAPRNVKNRLKSYLPSQGMLTAPLTFPVTDDLSTAAANTQFIIVPGVTTQVVIATPTGNLVVQAQTGGQVVPTTPNSLVVEYEYLGKRYRKVGIEGQDMTLP
jgi:hypothetical protein